MDKSIKLLFVLLMAFFFTACDANTKPEVFDKAELTELSESLVHEVINGNVSIIYDRVEKEIKKLTRLEDLELHVQARFEQAGAFEEIANTRVTLGKHPLTEAPIAGVVVATRCEKGTLLYNFGYNEALDITGFSMTFQLR